MRADARTDFGKLTGAPERLDELTERIECHEFL
jgi:hypothetical protein